MPSAGIIGFSVKQANSASATRRQLLQMSAFGVSMIRSDVAFARQNPDDETGLAGAVVSEGRRQGMRGSVVTPEEFGAKGDAKKTSGGWRGTDDVAAINAAIEWLHGIGGGELIISNPHLLASAHGKTALHLPNQQEPQAYIDYAIGLYPDIKLSFVGRGAFVAADGVRDIHTPLVCLAMVSPDRFVANVGIQGGMIRGFFVGVAAFTGRAVEWRIDDVTFADCGLAFVARALEQCVFRDLSIAHCGAGVICGGFWVDDADDYNEDGGYADKCLFSNIRHISDWDITKQGRELDEWFDQHVYQSTRNSELKPGRSAHSVVKSTHYSGVCGYGVRLMTRYGRPSNANFFDLFSHANSPRAAIKIDLGQANACGTVYGENVGFVDGQNRRLRVGYEAVDPYLGPGKRLPCVVSGVSSIMAISLQHIVADRAADTDHIMNISDAWTSLGGK